MHAPPAPANPVAPSRQPTRSISRRSIALVATALLGVWTLASVGCAAVGFAAIAAQSVKDSRPKQVEAEYTGLRGKSYAVVVTADRSIQAEFPSLVNEITARINDQLFQYAGASAFIPSQEILQYLYQNPSWKARPFGELAATLSVERLIIVDLNEFRLYDPGNQYLWDGMASGTVSVIEADSALPDEYVMQRAIRVRFPDEFGVGSDQFSRQAVGSVLLVRFVNRSAWLFYDHEEEAMIPY